MTCKDCIETLKRIIGKLDWELYAKDLEALYMAIDVLKKLEQQKYIELPNVEIGQELFYIDRFTKTVKSDIVSRLNWEQTDLGIQTGIWSENNGFSEFFSDIGKTLFLTKEEAEAKLKEINNGTT